MTWQARYGAWLRLYGESGILSVITGTACPCMSYKNRVGYSEEYHRLNPGSADCLGTGLISRTTTTTSIYFMVASKSALETSNPEMGAWLESIGEIKNSDLFIKGVSNASTDAQVDISVYTEQNAFITYNSINYTIRDVFKTPKSTGMVGRLCRRT